MPVARSLDGFARLAERRQQAREPAGAEPALALDGRQIGEVALERLDPRLVGEQALLVAAAEQDGRALAVDAARELAEQRRLADPRLAAGDGDAERARRRSVPRHSQPGERRGAALRARGAGERGGQGRLCRRRDRTNPTPADLLHERARLGTGRDPQLPAQPLAQRVGRGERRRAVAGHCQQPDQLAMGRLGERLVLDRAACPTDGRGEVARGLGTRDERREDGRDLSRVLTANLQHPVGVEPGEQLAAHRGRACLQLAGGPQRPKVRQIHVRAQLDVFARGHERFRRCQRAAKLVERVAQGLARALLGDIRAEPAREP